jgi:hypothetical protein
VLGVSILVAHPEDLIRMKTAASQFRDRPEPKRRQDLDDIAVLERLRADKQSGPGEAGRPTAGRSGQDSSPRRTTGSRDPAGRKGPKLGR